MSLSYGQVVGINSLLALKSFSVFLFNYSLHERPNFIERAIIKAAKQWIDLRARKEFIDLKRSDLKNVSLRLNDCQTSFFTVLYLANQPELTFSTGQELFQCISNTELEFERLKHPKDEAAYLSPKDTEI